MNSEVFTYEERNHIETVKDTIKSRLRVLLSHLPTKYIPYFNNAILSGGAIASLFRGEEPNDWDLYLENMIQVNDFQNTLLHDKVTIDDLVLDINPNYRTVTVVDGKYVTENAVTFKNKLQVITNNCSSAREIFDFIHCMPYYRLGENKFYISRAQYDAIMKKTLIFNQGGSRSIDLFRQRKFLERGWVFEDFKVTV